MKVEVDVQKLARLEEDARFLSELHAAGVDSWEGYELAQENFQDNA